jgi:hypothetical protein
VQADRGVGRPRAAADEHRRRLAGQHAIAVRGEGAAGLVADRHQADAVALVTQRLDHRQEALARNREGRVHAGIDQRLDQGCACFHARTLLW